MSRTAILLILISLASWALAQPEKEKNIDPNELGLTQLPLDMDDRVVLETNYQGTHPGKNKMLSRSYDEAPPMIPHDVKDYLPIGLRNECLNCHKNPSSVWQKRGIKEVPESHYVNREGEIIKAHPSVRDVYGGFYNCSMCHSPQTNAPLLKENIFKPDR